MNDKSTEICMDHPPSPSPSSSEFALEPGAAREPVQRTNTPLLRLLIVAAVLVLPLALVLGLLPRRSAQQEVRARTQLLTTPSVSIVSPQPSKGAGGVPLPAELAAFTEAPIYARANGYLRRWLADIGDKVEAGQLLAEIDTPELDQELERSRADLAQAEAALDLATTTAERWGELLKTSSVSVQETAEKKADFKLKKALLQSAAANVRRLEQLKRFAKVTAPFAGVITARRTDVGQLIVAGNGQELFRLAQTEVLRVYVHVPQELSRLIAAGQQAEVTVPELPGRSFAAKVTRTASAFDPSSRTLLTELQLTNSKGELFTGSYAQVRFPEAGSNGALVLPANTLLFRAEGTQVGVVGADNKVELRSVKLGRDFGRTLEVREGLTSSDRVILNPSDSLMTGTLVHIASNVNRLTGN